MARNTRRGRRLSAVLAGVAAATVALAGCGGSGTPDDSDDASGALVMYNDNPQWEEAWTKAGEVVEQETGYSFAPTSLPSTANYTQTVLTSLPTNRTGDIIKWWSGKMLQGLAATGQLQDLTAVWDGAVEAGNLNDDLRDYYTADGKVYAMPFIQSYWVNYYSKSAFEDAGIDGPPETWAEFEVAAEKLAAAGYQVCTGQGDGWPSFVPFQMFLGATSPDFYNELTNNEAEWTDPEVEQALTTWKKWIDNGWMTPADTKLFDCPALMKSGRVGIAPGGTWQNGDYRAAGLTDADYGAFLTPSATNGQPPIVFIEGGAIAVPTNAPHGEGALTALSAWLNPSVQEVWAPLVGDASPNATVENEDPVIDSVSTQVGDSNAVILNRYYESLPPKLVQSTISTLGGFMVSPNVGQTMADLQQQAEVEWAAWEANPSIG